MADTYDNLNRALYGRLPAVAKTVAEVVGHMLIKLTHDHLLPLDYWCYGDVLLRHITRFSEYTTLLKVCGGESTGWWAAWGGLLAKKPDASGRGLAVPHWCETGPLV